MTKKQQKEFEDFLKKSLIDLDLLEKNSAGIPGHRIAGRLAECKYITNQYLGILGRGKL